MLVMEKILNIDQKTIKNEIEYIGKNKMLPFRMLKKYFEKNENISQKEKKIDQQENIWKEKNRISGIFTMIYNQPNNHIFSKHQKEKYIILAKKFLKKNPDLLTFNF